MESDYTIDKYVCSTSYFHGYHDSSSQNYACVYTFNQ